MSKKILFFAFMIFFIGLGASVSAECGNGLIEEGEECDSGLLNGFLCWAGYEETCTYCTSTCEVKELRGNYCGDGEKQICEECDDGNNIDGDGCSSECLIEDDVEENCTYDAAIRYSYPNSYGTGIAIRPLGGDWIEEETPNLTQRAYEVKYFIDNLGSEEILGLEIEFLIGNESLENYFEDLNRNHSKIIEINLSEMCGAQTLYLNANSEEDCNPEDNYAEREIHVYCQGEPPEEPYCGDGICNGDETWQSCPSDCERPDDGDDDDEKDEKDGECCCCTSQGYIEYGTPFKGEKRIIVSSGDVVKEEPITLNANLGEGSGEFSWWWIPLAMFFVLIVLLVVWIIVR